MYKSAPYFLEIMPFGVTKGSMLPMLLEKLGFTNEEMIAFGDNYNDITMIGYAGLGVAMGNAEEDVKRLQIMYASQMMMTELQKHLKNMF